ncbi:MAG TPA: CDP-diacylglycerol--glycerol-3-phosphate 3-phosphatidyltransferase [Firmicutes bacterium]|nr:CDP-diacylglycerol--glycerol-3-phosphate 3-phosphatidyltransferase [Bacillota bacterium]
MTLATLFTLSRIFLVPLFMTVVFLKLPYGGYAGALVFVLAAATDGLDGYLARRRNEVTRLGVLLDPLADKLLISAALVSLVQLGDVSAAVAVLIIGREFAVTGLRLVAAAEGVVIPANGWGKAKTLAQIVAVVATLIRLPLAPHLMWLAAGVTVLSGVAYFAGAPVELILGRLPAGRAEKGQGAERGRSAAAG